MQNYNFSYFSGKVSTNKNLGLLYILRSHVDTKTVNHPVI